MKNTNLCTNEEAKQHLDSIVIDGLSYYYDGPSKRLQPQMVTATNVTVAETERNLSETLLEVMDVLKHIETDPGVILVETASDIVEAKNAGKIGLVMGLQDSLPVEDDLRRIYLFYRLGVRIMQLTYNLRSHTGDGCLEKTDGGLSRFGQQFIKECGEIGMLVDLSHAGRKTSLQAMECMEQPPVFSHANPNSVTENPRNLTDEQIRAVADKGGVIGCCFWGPLCWKNKARVRPSVDDYLDHIDYVVNLVGIHHVGIAGDTPCTEDMEWINSHGVDFNKKYPEIAGPYCEQVSEERSQRFPEGLSGLMDLATITAGLARRGYQPEDLKKVLGENFLRVFKQVWRPQ